MYKCIWILLVLCSCNAKWHEKKFYQKGGKFECEPKIISRIDTLITKEGDTVFNTVYKTIYEPKVEYKTKWQYRFDNKRFKDSLDHLKRTYSDSLKYAFKSKKSEDKKVANISKHENKTKRTEIRKESKTWWVFWIITGSVLTLVANQIFKKIKNEKTND
jgi:hypothetical protein